MDIILDNIIFSLQKSGGISVVWSELLNDLLTQSEFKIHIMEYKNSNKNIFRSKINISKHPIITKSNLFLFINRYLNPIIKHDETFIFHSSYYRICKNKKAINITTIHDFTYEYFSKGIKRILHSYQKKRAIKYSDYIICISENTKKDLLFFYPSIDENKIRVIYNGVSDNYHQISSYNNDLFFKAYSYALFVGSRAKYKNFNLAVESISKSKLNLLIIGNELSQEEIKYLETTLPNRYKYIGYVSNDTLNIYYNFAYCLLYLSSYEGFGIPILEAQKAGCPVIAYNSSSIPEVIGSTPLLIYNLNATSVLNCINILQDPIQREMIIQKGLENANQFSWKKMSQEIIKLYREIHK